MFMLVKPNSCFYSVIGQGQGRIDKVTSKSVTVGIGHWINCLSRNNNLDETFRI